MAILSALYLSIFLVLLPSSSVITPDLSAAFSQFFSAATILPLQVFWVTLFLYYGKSRVTDSTVSFHVIAERL